MQFSSTFLFATLALVGSSTAQGNGLCVVRESKEVCAGKFSKPCNWSTGLGVHYSCCLPTIECSQPQR
ncbi:hypothetical protein SNK05_007520 [Fusarium graminearum]|nr:unnamed protein product [Fusarium graminearum]